LLDTLLDTAFDGGPAVVEVHVLGCVERSNPPAGVPVIVTVVARDT